MPIPDKKDIRRFCELDGWEEPEATSPDHDRYRKRLANGTLLRTKVSHGRGPIVRNPGLWTNVWRHQLGLESEEQFWEVLTTRKPAPRGEPTPEPRAPQMDTWLFEALVFTYGVEESKVRAMDADEALALYLEFCEGGTAPA
ncbi:MAG: hypothetical protein ACR2NB_08655 [Solirubrobacteraceae bacterium]